MVNTEHFFLPALKEREKFIEIWLTIPQISTLVASVSLWATSEFTGPIEQALLCARRGVRAGLGEGSGCAQPASLSRAMGCPKCGVQLC